MEMHGGWLALSSELGVGTAVTVVFPPDRAILDPSLLNSGSTEPDAGEPEALESSRSAA